MSAARSPRRSRFWHYVRGLAAPVLLLALFAGVLVDTLRSRLRGDEEFDQAALREWVEESRVFRESLPRLVHKYLKEAQAEAPSPDDLFAYTREIGEQLKALADPTKKYQGQLPLFPTIYRLELQMQAPDGSPLPPIVWESELPRSKQTSQVRRLDHRLLGRSDPRAVLRIEYQLHAYDKRQRDEQLATRRLLWVSVLAVTATAIALLWIYLVQKRERERERQRLLGQQRIHEAEELRLGEELRRQEAERRHEETERKLLEQRLATQAAEQHALELKSQLYASIGIMAGSYAHNIKNLLVRPNDLLRRCLEADGLSPDQGFMLREVRQTLGTVTERLQQILQTVRSDPTRSVMTRLDLSALARDTQRTWQELAQEKWKLTLTVETCAEPLWIEGDLSHLQQAAENLLFNARDATFEMRNYLRDQARCAAGLDAAGRRQALIDAAAWKGAVALRTWRQDGRAVLEVRDNGIGMSEEVHRRCTETHFSTKRDNAIYEGNNTGMGLGLSFVVVILEHHKAKMEIESAPQQGALFRVSFPLAE